MAPECVHASPASRPVAAAAVRPDGQQQQAEAAAAAAAAAAAKPGERGLEQATLRNRDERYNKREFRAAANPESNSGLEGARASEVGSSPSTPNIQLVRRRLAECLQASNHQGATSGMRDFAGMASLAGCSQRARLVPAGMASKKLRALSRHSKSRKL